MRQPVQTTQDYPDLLGAITQLRATIAQQLASSSGQPEAEMGFPHEGGVDIHTLPEQQSGSDSPLKQLVRTFQLSTFEQNILLLCAGLELDPELSHLCAQAQGSNKPATSTFCLAGLVLHESDWGAFTPEAPLRYWRFIELGPGQSLLHSPLRIDEWVLHWLMGRYCLDQRLTALVKPLSISLPSALPASHQTLVNRLVKSWTEASENQTDLPILQLTGRERATKRAIALTVCQSLGLKVHLMSAQFLPTTPQDLNELIRLWEREALMTNSALFLECDELELTEPQREAAILQLMEQMRYPLLVSGLDRRRSPQRSLLTFEVRPPTSAEQRTLWQEALGPIAETLEPTIDILTAQFNLSAPAIYHACLEALNRTDTNLSTALWDSCRAQGRPQLEDLAQRLELSATWEDLVLPEAQLQVLQEMVSYVQQRAKVYERWGFARKGERGLGISALFAGASGTGKTMAAEVIAGVLNMDLYRIDLSAVVSKYIGETEKNLRRIFDAAEMGGVVLLFDEADALFGKRSEVKDSHDRHANVEVSYLLQRMEAYRGLAILTTNLKDALDQAFLRRLRFVVRFPFPDAVQRAEIWRRVFPRETPIQDLDFTKLARLSVAGGNIRNIALKAAFLAADAEEAVMMKHLLKAAQSELAKIEKGMTDSEVKGWI